MKLPLILFDLDNTLYPPESGVLQEINRRIGIFCAGYFGIGVEEANEMRRGMHLVYGTTLQWLRVCHGMNDPEPYIKAIHPEDMSSFVSPDPQLRFFLSELPVDYVIFTNAPMEHARRTLKALNLNDLFPRVWDLRSMSYQGKPHRDSYELILGDLGLKAGDALLVDDSEVNIEGFEKLGGRVLPVGNLSISAWMKKLSILLES